MKYSIVIPLYNEEESIYELYNRIAEQMDKIAPSDYEIIFVNDGSRDKSLQNIKKLILDHDNIRVYSFRINQGKSAGLSIGFEHAKGKYIITMDADLQDEPSEIPKLIAKLAEGYDMVSGWKENRQDPVDKTLPSKIFNFIVSNTSKVYVHDFNCGFKIYKKQVVKEIKIYGQLYRFIPVLVAERGFRVGEVKVRHNKRKYGHSKYNWKRVFAGIIDLATVLFFMKYGKRPLHLFGFIGCLISSVGFLALFYLAVLHFLGQHIGERPLLAFGETMVIAGLQIIFTGIIADMITKYNHNDSDYPLLSDEEI